MKFLNFKNWEYWPSYMFYLPNIPYAIYLAIKARSFVFFSAINPAFKHSGNGCESKFETIELIPKKFKPTSIFIEKYQLANKTLQKLQTKNIKYPLIIKPDIGFRGLLVKKINSENELLNYLEKYQHINLIIQEFVSFENECGIFYHRLPNEANGKITSVTLKKYLSVIGDGASTLKKLIDKNKRAKHYYPLLTELHKNNFNLILKKDEVKVLNIIGNHAKGTQFINGNKLISNELEIAIDSIAKQIPNFYYGRLDIKYQTFEDLLLLNNLKIIEINGIISEPTHIYDPHNITYIKALQDIRKHWKIMYQIATINHRIFNIKYESFSSFYRSLKQLKKYSKQLVQ
jgi:hypothetical protein